MGKFKHGLARRGSAPPEFRVWCKMRQRCDSPASADFKNYGGRGIKVCDRWQDFAAFYSDMGSRPTPLHTIERVNNDIGYGPDNCVWATRAQQSVNRRPRSRASSCSRGHPFDEVNTYHRQDGKRGCRTCRKANMGSFYSRQKELSA